MQIVYKKDHFVVCSIWHAFWIIIDSIPSISYFESIDCNENQFKIQNRWSAEWYLQQILSHLDIIITVAIYVYYAIMWLSQCNFVLNYFILVWWRTSCVLSFVACPSLRLASTQHHYYASHSLQHRSLQNLITKRRHTIYKKHYSESNNI